MTDHSLSHQIKPFNQKYRVEQFSFSLFHPIASPESSYIESILFPGDATFRITQE